MSVAERYTVAIALVFLAGIAAISPILLLGLAAWWLFWDARRIARGG